MKTIKVMRRAFNSNAKYVFAYIGCSASKYSYEVEFDIASQFMAKIASGFSVFAKIHERKIEECDIHEILLQIINLFQEKNH